jgi:hypothetical protein
MDQLLELSDDELEEYFGFEEFVFHGEHDLVGAELRAFSNGWANCTDRTSTTKRPWTPLWPI